MESENIASIHTDTGIEIALVHLHNAREKIATGVFTRFFTRPVLLFAQYLAFLCVILFFVFGIIFWIQFDPDVMISDQLQQSHVVQGTEAAGSSFSPIVSYLVLVLISLPAVIFLLIGYLLRAELKRIKVFGEVEAHLNDAIDKMESPIN